MEAADEEFLGIMRYHVGLLLLFLGVDEKGTAGHGCHVAVLAAYIDVDCSIVKLVTVAVVLELVHRHAVARLDHDRGEILKEVDADARVSLGKLSNCV